MSVEGIDVAEGNGSIDWRKVHKAGKRFAICKVSEGDYLDPTFSRERVKAIRAAGIIAGGYVFLRPKRGRSGRDEFRIFHEHARKAGLYAADHQHVIDVRPVLDVEASALGPLQTLHYVQQAVDECLHLTGGRHPIIYAGAYWRDELHNPKSSFDCELWFPQYGVAHPSKSFIPRAWPHGPAIWQYSERGSVPGVPGDCDLDRFLGRDIATFRRELCI